MNETPDDLRQKLAKKYGKLETRRYYKEIGMVNLPVKIIDGYIYSPNFVYRTKATVKTEKIKEIIK